MAHRAAWESASDLGPYAKAGGTNWRRVLLLLLLVGAGTFVAGYYFPLYQAQQTLSDDYRDLNQKSRSLSESTAKAEADLKSISAQRDQLQSEHVAHERATKLAREQANRFAVDLGAKLDKFVKKGSALVAVREGSTLVALDSALLFGPLKLDVSSTGKGLLCEISKIATGLTLHVRASMREDAVIPAVFQASFGNPWALSAARAAAVAQLIEGKCAFPASALSATGSGKHDPHAAELAGLSGPERVVLEIHPR